MIYFFIILLLLSSGSLLYQMQSAFAFVNIVFALYSYISLIRIGVLGNKSLKKPDHDVFFYLIGLVIIFLTNSVLVFYKSESIYEIMAYVNGLIFLYFLLNAYGVEKLSRCFFDIIYYSSCFTLLLFFIMLFVPTDIVNKLPEIHTRYTQPVRTLYVANFQQLYMFGDRAIWRQQLFFWEPAIYSMYLLLAIITGFISKENKWRLFIIAIASLTTFSTTGIFVLLPVLVYKIFKTRRIKYIVILIAFMTLIFLLAYQNYKTKTDISEIKYNEELVAETSYGKRLADLTYGVECFLKYPLGIGFKGDIYKELPYAPKIYIGSGSSNGLLSLLNQFGVFGIAWFALLFIRKTPILLTAITIILYMNEPLVYTPMFCFFIIMLSKYYQLDLYYNKGYSNALTL